jgi:hypothetical protein
MQAALWEGARSATGGWAPMDHAAFVRARASAMANVGGKGPAALYSALAHLLPQHSYNDLVEHEVRTYVAGRLDLDVVCGSAPPCRVRQRPAVRSTLLLDVGPHTQAWFVSFKLMAQRKLDLCRAFSRTEKEVLTRSRTLLQACSQVRSHATTEPFYPLPQHRTSRRSRTYGTLGSRRVTVGGLSEMSHRVGKLTAWLTGSF